MKSAFLLLALGLSVVGLRAAEPPAIEAEVRALVDSPKVTVVHLWAPWCASCAEELAKNKWADFIAKNPKVQFVFVTIWNRGMGDGREVLAKNGVGPQPNFKLFLHPNGAMRDDLRMTQFLGLPVTWTPSTWVFRAGKLRYAINYGELRFPMLQQMLEDTDASWDR